MEYPETKMYLDKAWLKVKGGKMTKLQNNPLWLAGYAWATDRLEKYALGDIRTTVASAPTQDEFVLGVLQALADHEKVEAAKNG